MENLPQLQEKLVAICDNYLTVQQDILETFVDRGQLRKLIAPTVLASGKRIPGLKLDNSRQLALMHALVRFAHIAAGSTFTTAEIYPHTLAALGLSAEQYSLASLRYDLGKLRAKGLVEKLPKSRRYRLCSRAIQFVCSFSNSSNASTARSLPGCFSLTGRTPNSMSTSEPSWTACIKRSSTISITSFVLLVSRPPEASLQREQNSR